MLDSLEKKYRAARVRTARPCAPLVRTVEFDALTVDFRGLLRRDLCATELRYNVGHPGEPDQ
jgi:hypothetical protein